jgi:hypothetical protein
MAARAVELIGSIIPLLIVIPLFGAFASGLFGGMFGTPQTRRVSKTATNVARVELQKNFVSTRRYYAVIYLKIKNNTGSTQNYYVKIQPFLANQTDPVTDPLLAEKVTLANGEVATFSISSDINDPSVSQQKLNTWIVAELGAPADVLSFFYSESEV